MKWAARRVIITVMEAPDRDESTLGLLAAAAVSAPAAFFKLPMLERYVQVPQGRGGRRRRSTHEQSFILKDIYRWHDPDFKQAAQVIARTVEEALEQAGPNAEDVLVKIDDISLALVKRESRPDQFAGQALRWSLANRRAQSARAADMAE